MSVEMISVNPPITEDELLRLLDESSVSFPKDYLDFVRRHNGCRPEPNVFTLDESSQFSVTEFYPVDRVISERSKLQGRLPKDAWPIAYTESGNLVLLSLESEWMVHVWDHEVEECERAASTFTDFLSMLSPFSADDVELAPGQVVSAWIDPEFLRSLK